MVLRGKSINLFLMDGIPTGRIKVTLANWIGGGIYKEKLKELHFTIIGQIKIDIKSYYFLVSVLVNRPVPPGFIYYIDI